MFSYADCTKEERDACLPIIDDLLECTRIARTQGVLVLEDYAWNHKNYFLRFLLMMVVDGTDPALVKGIAETLISSENRTGRALLERILITEGVLSIQAGEIPQILEAKLLCYLGESYLQARGIPENPNNPERKDRIADAMAKKAPLPECVAFAELLQSLSNRDMQMVLKETDMKEIGISLKGCGEDAASHVGANLSSRLEAMIAEDMKRMGAIRQSDILESQAAMVRIIERLAECGEINAQNELLQKFE